MTKNEIYKLLTCMKENNISLVQKLNKMCFLTDYSHLVRKENDITIWTDAFQKALNENEIVFIPNSDKPYYIDAPLIIPSSRHIEAQQGATIKLLQGTKTLLLRNQNTADGTHKPIDRLNKDINISINGGIWEESQSGRAGYGKSGMYDESRSFYGVSTCMLFNNIENLTLTNMTFVHTGGFSVQTGDLKNAVFENIKFIECFADGLHINGNCENVFIKNISGEVGDDLVALNMYDWQDSSINFGPNKNIWCETLELSRQSKYKAIRILPGTYYFDDGSSVDCSLNNAVFKNIRGIKTFKMYFQTPSYDFTKELPEKGDSGSCDNIFFEDIEIYLDEPIDHFSEYLNSDPIKGSFASFELGSNICKLHFENIDVTIDKKKYPLSYFICIGPKSVRINNREFFNPDISSVVEKIVLENVRINNKKINDIKEYVKEISFDNIYNDNKSSGKGIIKELNII